MHLVRSRCAFALKTKVIHCVLSVSDVGSKWWLLCSLRPKIKHLNCLGDIVYTYSGVKSMADCWPLTQGGSVLKRQCSSIVVGGALARVTSSAKNLWTAWSETVLMIFGDKKKHCTGWIFIIMGWLCYTHCQHIFMFKHHIILHLMPPLKNVDLRAKVWHQASSEITYFLLYTMWKE